MLKENASSQFLAGRLRKDTLIYVPVFLIPAFLNIISLMIFTRLFSPTVYGEYNLVVNTTIIISSFLSQWIVLSVQRYRPEYKVNCQLNEFNIHLRFLLLCIIGLFCLTSFFLYEWMPPFLLPFQKYFWSSVCLISSSVLFLVLGAVYQSDLLAASYRNINVFSSCLKLLLSLGLFWLVVPDVNMFIWGAFFSQLFLLWPLLKHINFFQTANQSTPYDSFYCFFKTFLLYGFPLIGWYIGTTFLNLTDRYMIEYFKTSHEVGIYSANFTIAVQALALFCNPLYSAAQPLLMNMDQRATSQQDLEKTVTNYTKIYLWIAVPFGLYFSVYRSEISKLILGSDFSEGAVFIPILVIGFFAWNLSLYGQLCMQLDQKTKGLFLFVMMAAAMNIFLNFYFIPAFGLAGAAVSTAIGFVLYTIFIYVDCLKRTKWKIPWATAGKLAAFVAVVIYPFDMIRELFFSSFPPVVSMIAGLGFFLLYVVYLIVCNEFDKKVLCNLLTRKEVR